jgi:hypothetical protein
MWPEEGHGLLQQQKRFTKEKAIETTWSFGCDERVASGE